MATDIDTEQTLAIGKVARAAGISTSKIRYYERQGLLPAPDRVSGQRRYDRRALQLLRVIEISQAAGFSLREIKQLLHGFDRATPPSRRWRGLAQAKMSEVEALLARVEAMRALLERGIACGCLTWEDCELLADGARGASPRARSGASADRSRRARRRLSARTA